MTDLYDHIGQKIRELRKGRGMSQEGLAADLDVPANTLSRWETGTYKPTAKDLDAIARLFKVSITEFFPGMQSQATRVAALTSATGGLDDSDFEEIIKYAEYRKALRTMSAHKGKRTRPKT